MALQLEAQYRELVERYRRTGGEPTWGDGPEQRDEPITWLLIVGRVIGGAALAFLVVLLIAMLSFAGPVLGTVSALVLFGLSARSLYRKSWTAGIALFAGATFATVVMVPYWIEMNETDRTLDRLAAEVCAIELPEDTTIESCDGELGHNSNGNQCELEVVMVISSELGHDELRPYLLSASLPLQGNAPPINREYQEEDSGQALFTATLGFVKDWRCQ